MAEGTTTLEEEPDEEVVTLYLVMTPLRVRGGVQNNTTSVRETGDPLNEATGPGAETQEGSTQKG